jgi:hypothetical protein
VTALGALPYAVLMPRSTARLRLPQKTIRIESDKKFFPRIFGKGNAVNSWLFSFCDHQNVAGNRCTYRA